MKCKNIKTKHKKENAKKKKIQYKQEKKRTKIKK